MSINALGMNRVMYIIYKVVQVLDVHSDVVELVVDGNILDRMEMLDDVGIYADIPQPVVTAVVRPSPCGHPHCGVRRCTEAERLRMIPDFWD